jgi:nucleotide-binding universal stress UspA family protein
MHALKEQSAVARLLQGLTSPAHLPGCWENPANSDAAHIPDLETEPDWSIRHILVPTDFSTYSAEAVGRAAALARRYNATLTILHVIDVNPAAARAHCGPAEDLMGQLWDTSHREMRRLKESFAGSQTKIQTMLVEGLPAEAIVENSSGFDLLIMGEPRSKSWKLFSRHTARRVIEKAKCPVLVVPVFEPARKEPRLQASRSVPAITT